MRRLYRKFKNRYYTAFLIVRLLVPVFLTVLLLLLLISAGVLTDVVHPTHSLEVINPSDYHMYAVDFTWDGAGDDVLQGWYIRGSNQSPLIILCHGYDTNRTEVLSLASRLRDYGYNIFVYNLRGHGLSGQAVSSLGLKEVEDLHKAVEKLVQRPEVDFNRIGVYGSSLGAFVALKASKGKPHMRVLVLDSVYPNIETFISMKVEDIVGFRTSLLSFFVRMLYRLYFRAPFDLVSAEITPEEYSGKSILFITGKDKASAGLAKETRRLYTNFKCRKEILNLANSRESLLFGEEKHRYDQFVLDYFRKELPLMEESVKIDLGNSPR